jgi:hypothetical protein
MKPRNSSAEVRCCAFAPPPSVCLPPFQCRCRRWLNVFVIHLLLSFSVLHCGWQWRSMCSRTTVRRSSSSSASSAKVRVALLPLRSPSCCSFCARPTKWATFFFTTAPLLPCVSDVRGWLEEHPQNVAAVHCKVGVSAFTIVDAAARLSCLFSTVLFSLFTSCAKFRLFILQTGKGRTGVLVASYLLHSQEQKDAKAAIE